MEDASLQKDSSASSLFSTQLAESAESLFNKNITDINVEIDSINEIPPELQISSISKAIKRQITRQVLDCKRIVEKEGSIISTGLLIVN